MLASEPNPDTETEFMSRYFTYYDMYNDLSARFQLGDIWNCISDLYANKISLSNYLDNTLSCQINDPYIISSLRQGYLSVDGDLSVGILSVNGYRLSTGMNIVFDNAERTTHHLSTIIPSLSAKTTTVDNNNNYITSITDYDGHVQRLGQASLTKQIGDNATKTLIRNEPAGDTRFEHEAILSIHVLTYSNLDDLRKNGKIAKNCIYMTIEDPPNVV